MEDIWWIRTASPKQTAAGLARPPPIAIMDPLWANAAAVSAAIGGAHRICHTMRERAVESVERSGLVAPDQSGKFTRQAMEQKRLDAVGHLSKWRVE